MEEPLKSRKERDLGQEHQEFMHLGSPNDALAQTSKVHNGAPIFVYPTTYKGEQTNLVTH